MTSLCMSTGGKDFGLQVGESFVVQYNEESVNEQREIRTVQYQQFCVHGRDEATVRDTSDTALIWYSDSVCQC